MSEQNGSADAATQGSSTASEAQTFDKGKGKAPAETTTQEVSMGEEDDSSSEEEVDEVSSAGSSAVVAHANM
jgi:hypothetical protein